MRVQISLPDAAWKSLCDIAQRERRYPKQQLEFIVLRTLRDAPAAEQNTATTGR